MMYDDEGLRSVFIEWCIFCWWPYCPYLVLEWYSINDMNNVVLYLVDLSPSSWYMKVSCMRSLGLVGLGAFVLNVWNNETLGPVDLK